MARIDLATPEGASIEVKELTTADRIELCGDEDQLTEFLLNQDGMDAYRVHVERTRERAQATEDKTIPGNEPKRNRAYEWLHTLADYFLTCSDPQGFPWGETLADIWFKAPAGIRPGVPNFWTYGARQERKKQQLDEAQAKN